jgi:hypothetical protein
MPLVEVLPPDEYEDEHLLARHTSDGSAAER